MKFLRNLGCKFRAALYAFSRASGCPECGAAWTGYSEGNIRGIKCTRCDWVDDMKADFSIKTPTLEIQWRGSSKLTLH